MQKLFEAAWAELYPGLIEWVGAVAGRQRCRRSTRRPRRSRPTSTNTRPRSRTSSRRSRPAASADARRRRRPHRLVPGRSGDIRIQAASRHPCHRRCRDRRRDADARPRPRMRRRKICAAAIAALLAGQTPADADARRLLLQPDRAGLRHLAEGHLPSAGRSVCRGRGQPGRSAREDAPRAARKAEADEANAGSRRSPARCSDDARAALSLAVLLGRAADAQERCVPYEIVGDAIPKPLTGEPGDPARGRAIVVKRESTCLLCHSGPFPEERFQGDLAPNLKGAGARWSAGELRLRLVDATRLNPATIMPSYYRIDGLDRVAPNFRGKPVLDRPADRGRGGLSGDAEGLKDGRCKRRRRAFLGALPARRADRARRRAPRRTSMKSAIRQVVGKAHGEARQGQARRAAAGRERQLRDHDGHGRQPDDGAGSRQGDPRLHREEPAAQRHQRDARPARRQGRVCRPASGSPTRRPWSAIAELSDGSFWSDKVDVIVTLGACLEDSGLMAARTLINVPPKAKRGEVIEIKTLISHIMETGFRHDNVGQIVPRDIITSFVCTLQRRGDFQGRALPGDRRQPVRRLPHRRDRERHAGVPMDRRQRLRAGTPRRKSPSNERAAPSCLSCSWRWQPCPAPPPKFRSTSAARPTTT